MHESGLLRRKQTRGDLTVCGIWGSPGFRSIDDLRHMAPSSVGWRQSSSWFPLCHSSGGWHESEILDDGRETKGRLASDSSLSKRCTVGNRVQCRKFYHVGRGRMEGERLMNSIIGIIEATSDMAKGWVL